MNDLTDTYAGVYDRTVGFGKRSCLLLIDVAQACFDAECPLHAGVDEALASALRLRKAGRAAGIPVVLTRVTYDPKGITGGRFFETAAPLRAFLPGAPTGAFATEVVPEEGEIIVRKQYPGAVFATSLASTLTSLGCDSVLPTGLTTSGCVRATCVDAMSHGFRTLVVAEACGDRHADPHRANLFDRNATYADVISEAAATDDLVTLVG